jgi:hypothetical protein
VTVAPSIVAMTCASAAIRGLVFVVVVLGLAPPGRAASLDEVNEHWRGATCRLRLPIEIKKGTDGDGWSRSPHYGVYDPLERVLFWSLWVSDRAALVPLLAGDVLPPGTLLEARKWRLVKPQAQEGVTLDLVFRGAPAEARFEFRRRGSFAHDSVKLERLDQVERLVRLEVCDLEPAERVPPPVPAATAPVAPPETPDPDAPAAPGSTFRPELEIRAVAVRPAHARSGDPVDLMAVYRVAGVPAGSFFEIVERREIFRGTERLQRLEQSVPRTSDDYTSTWPVRLPAGLEPGLYRFVFEATLAGLSARGEALFEVRP